MNKFRVIPLEEEEDSFMKMATEEAIMNAVRTGAVPPTLRFYSWKQPAVALGFFQQADKELNLEACKKDKIEIFRRITGGGAVYKSPEFELNYSFIIREDEPTIPKDVEKSYKLICGALQKGLEKLGFKTTFKPINDLLLNGKKISGNAQTRVNNVLLHHGTILLKPEAKKMFSYLNIDDEKLRAKKVSNAQELVTGLWEQKKVSKKELEEAITKGFEETFAKQALSASLNTKEKKDAQQLYSKYADITFVEWR